MTCCDMTDQCGGNDVKPQSISQSTNQLLIALTKGEYYFICHISYHLPRFVLSDYDVSFFTYEL